MSATPPNVPDDPLPRAEAALRRSAGAEGPSDESLARALAVARAAEGRSVSVPSSRRRIVMSTLKIAAAVVAAGGLFYVARPPMASATAFEEVAQKLHDAHTIVYRSTSTVEGAPPAMSPMKMRLFFRAPNLMRVEAELAGAAGPVTILDGTRGRMVVLDAAGKSAVVIENARPPEDLAAKTVELLRNLPGKDGKPAGRERIGDVEAEGFRVAINGGTWVAWVDPKTRLPVRIDVANRVASQDVRATLSDFLLDPPLDDSLFRAEPPEGYAVQSMNGGILFDKPEAAVVRLLRVYAEHNAGVFPGRLDDVNAYKSLDAAFPKPKAGEKPSFTKIDPKMMELIMSFGRVIGLRNELKGYGYKADGVKLGDAAKIVFWYKPEGSEKYRAVYGDLHVGDVAADELPEKPAR